MRSLYTYVANETDVFYISDKSAHQVSSEGISDSLQPLSESLTEDVLQVTLASVRTSHTIALGWLKPSLPSQHALLLHVIYHNGDSSHLFDTVQPLVASISEI